MSQSTLSQLDFSYGIDRDSAPQEIDPRAVFDHINGLTEKSGSPFKRGGSANKSGSAFGSLGLTFLWDGYFDVGQRTVFANASDFGVLAADDSTVVNLGSDGLPYPKPSALLTSMLFIGGGYIYAGSLKAAAYSTGTISVTAGSKTVTGSGTTWNTLVDAGMLMQIGNGRVYPIASIDSTTQVTLRDPYEGSTAAGNAYAFNPLYKITTADPYPDSEFYGVCANRLIYKAEGKGNTLGFSEVENPDKQTVTIEASEIPNEHPFADGVELTGTATVGQTALGFTSGGTYSVEGLAFSIVDAAGTPNHRKQLLSRELVLWGGAGIATWQQAAIVPTLDGIYVLDGVRQPLRISAGIDELYRNYIAQNYRPGQATVYRGHYFLPILSPSGTAIRDVLVARLDHPERSNQGTTFPWSRLTGAGGSLSALAVRSATSPAKPLLLGAEIQASSRVVDCSAFFEPDAVHKNDADGSSFSWQLVTRDYETGALTENVVRYLRSRYELIDAVDELAISAQWFFQLVDTGGLWLGNGFIGITKADAGGSDQTAFIESLDAGLLRGVRDDGSEVVIHLTGPAGPVTASEYSVPFSFVEGNTDPLLQDVATFTFELPGDQPVIRFAYGFGRRDSGGHLWDHEFWDDLDADDADSDLVWETEEDEVYYRLACVAPEDDGLHPFRCRVNKTARYMRFRLSNDEPCASLRLRSLELFVRPSQAERR